MENPPKHLLSVKYLFYDNHSDGRDKYYKIRPNKDGRDDTKKVCQNCEQLFNVKSMYKEHIENCA